MDTQAVSGRVALETDARDQIRALVQAHGEADAARMLCVHPQTLARGAAGLGLNRSTASLIVRRLADLGAEPQP